ncbi:DNA replication pre-initiation complex subunit Cdc45 [Mucor mucedo]|uniref:DNA replication pre-initiation complex subunit Cdc45 n=1 Tax=Mucor mucedo TaxID=29922 RepID=UPI00221FF9BF|nr:DNA replication pre-initiation complex subunit Cdc45 [Mucor mucedo]KAI7869615.1 DNA replication pre-initiation complex subunit Cdc45 [Mucor mucedo]
MVRITNNIYHEAYEYIKSDAQEGNCIVFVAADVDSICAIRIFQALLKSDIIPHKIVPVSGYKDLVAANEKLVRRDDDLRSIVMINCGGLGNILECFDLNALAKVYIIDSHRPLNLDNMHPSNTQVCVFDDQDETEKINEVMQAFHDIIFREENDDDSDEDSDIDQESEDNDSDDSEGRTRDKRAHQRRRMNGDEKLSRAAKRQLRRKQNRLLAAYYSGGLYYGNSVSGAIYELVNQLGKSNNELLWLAIVGVTSQYVFEQMDTYKYAEKLEVFKDDRARLNVNRNEDGSLQTTNVVIKSEDEYRFMMFRHWSLYDSMYHSGYVSSKLGVWKDAGKKRLNNMFAKMGFSLQQCQQVYTHMDMDLKQMLRNKIEVIAPLYGLTDICFPSFTRSYGWECCLSASDVVYALSTILETSPAAAIRLGVNVNANWNENEDWHTAEESEEDATAHEMKSQRRKWWMKNFYTAYDALSSPSPDGILRGLKLCMKTQKAIVRQGTAIIDKRMAKLLNNFRFVNIRNGPDLSIFQHPLALTKLALFLTDAYREHGKKSIPFVISSLDEDNNTCLILASTGAPTFGEVRKNTFGLAFEEAAEKTGARISLDSFESSVVQVHDSDIEHFVETLIYKEF